MLSLRLGIDYFARIAACAALLTTSLIGQWLHNHAHHLDDHHCSQSEQSAHANSTSCGHSHSIPVPVDHGGSKGHHDSPAVPHDHDSCSICYVISQAFAESLLATGPIASEPLFESRQIVSEIAVRDAKCTPIARGPPVGNACHC